jgi:hypothetical protein
VDRPSYPLDFVTLVFEGYKLRSSSVMQLCAASCHLLPVKSKYFPP